MGWQPRRMGPPQGSYGSPRFPTTPKPPIVPTGQGSPGRPYLERVHRPVEVRLLGQPSFEVDTGTLRWTGTHPAAMTTEEFMTFLDEASPDELDAFAASCGPQELSFSINWREPPTPYPPPQEP